MTGADWRTKRGAEGRISGIVRISPGIARAAGSRYVHGMGFNYPAYFERRPELCGGALVVKGTRVPVRTLLASLAEGATEAELLADFPTVTPDGLRAVIAFAAASAGDDLPVPALPAIAA